jgi:hypothetical protein
MKLYLVSIENKRNLGQIRSIGLCRWYINITIKILDIIHRPVINLKYNVLRTGFCLRIQVRWAQYTARLSLSLSLCLEKETTSVWF